jgi:hypothetical protein
MFNLQANSQANDSYLAVVFAISALLLCAGINGRSLSDIESWFDDPYRAWASLAKLCENYMFDVVEDVVEVLSPDSSLITPAHTKDIRSVISQYSCVGS